MCEQKEDSKVKCEVEREREREKEREREREEERMIYSFNNSIKFLLSIQSYYRMNIIHKLN